MTMTAAAPNLETTDHPVRKRLTWIELSCLNCGELAGYIEDRRVVRPVKTGGISFDSKRRLRCGRCSGLLLTGDHVLSSLNVTGALD
jgi:hypothetical protein